MAGCALKSHVAHTRLTLQYALITCTDVKACLSELNKELRPCHFEIRGLHEDGKEIYGIVNTVRLWVH